MNKKSVLFLLISFLTLVSCEIYTTARLLQSVEYGPIRFYVEYDSEIKKEDALVQKNLLKIMNIVLQFWSQTIEIDYLPYLTYDIRPTQNPIEAKCQTFGIPMSLLGRKIYNKDYGILVQAIEDNKPTQIYSTTCFNTTKLPNGRHTWGLIHWNLEALRLTDPQQFQKNVFLGIREVLRLLGFSKLLFSNFQNKDIKSEYYLNGVYIQKEIQRQYGCSGSEGMPYVADEYFYWSRKLMEDQLMAAGQIKTNPMISYISLAVLQETGWYRRIYKQHGRFMNLGYLKGCKMLELDNCVEEEHCSQLNKIMPVDDRTALGECKNDPLTNCKHIEKNDNFICTDPNYLKTKKQYNSEMTGEEGHEKSRIFQSNIRKTEENGEEIGIPNFRCFRVQCTENSRSLSIKIGKKFAVCKFPNQKIEGISGYDGYLRCPTSFKEYCEPKSCPNDCNAQGVCLNGRCMCSPQYYGQACENLSAIGYAKRATYFNIASNNYCLEGSFRNNAGKCIQCPQRCSRCYNEYQCQLCLSDRIPNNGQC